jgi:DNA repair photolyase
MASIHLINVTLSLTTLDKKLASSMEPRSASPEMRLKTLEALAKNNIPCGVNLAPIIPGLTDEEIPELLKKATDAGGTSAGYIMLRLPLEVKDIFLPWLQNEYPDRYNKVVNKVTEMNNGRLYNSEFGKRFKGEGEYADFIRSLFNINCRKYGLNQEENSLDISNFTIPGKDQLSLFTDH